MTRQEKRRKGRETITVTRAQYEEMQVKILDQGFLLALGIPVIVLKEQYKWGSKSRLPEFVAQVMAEYSKLHCGKMDFQEVVDKVNTYTGINILEAYSNESKA